MTSRVEPKESFRQDKQTKLPLEYPWQEALRIYGKRFLIFLKVILANFVLLGMLLFALSAPLIFFGILLGSAVVAAIIYFDLLNSITFSLQVGETKTYSIGPIGSKLISTILNRLSGRNLIMRVILGVTLGLLGLAIGFILASVIGAGVSVNLVIVLLLAIFGAIVGFVTEWIIDESIRKNRELRRQLDEPRSAPMLFEGQVLNDQSRDETLAEVLRQLTALKESRLAVEANVPSGQDSGALTEALRQHSKELHQLREQITAKDAEVEKIRRKFETYQKSHPDELTHIRGIGQVYQRKLRDIGFSSYQQLAKADPAQIRRMLGIRDWQRVDIASWVQQARDWAEHS